MLRRIAAFFNPYERTGLRWWSYLTHSLLLLLLIGAASGFFAGAFVQHRLDEGYWISRTHDLGLVVRPLPSTPVVSASLPPRSITVAKLNAAWLEPVQNQDGQGACAGVSDSELLTYYVRSTHPGHPGWKASWEWPYSYYVDRYANGADAGSDPVADAEFVSTAGIPQLKVAPGTGIIRPMPSDTADPRVVNAAHWTLPVAMQVAYYGDPGDMVYQVVASIIASGRPAILGIYVTPSFDAAWNTGSVVYPGHEESNRGAHAIEAYAVPGITMSDGSPGVWLRNSWTKAWGTSGDVLVSAKELAHIAFAVWQLGAA